MRPACSKNSKKVGLAEAEGDMAGNKWAPYKSKWDQTV